MEEKLKTKLLEFEKSTFLIDLVKHTSGNLYISIEQIIHLNRDINQYQKIKINPSILNELIEILIDFQENIPNGKIEHSKNYITKEQQTEIIKRYFKNIPLKDIAVQYDCEEEVIKQVLFNNQIELVDNEIPKYKKHYYRFKKRKKIT